MKEFPDTVGIPFVLNKMLRCMCLYLGHRGRTQSMVSSQLLADIFRVARFGLFSYPVNA